MAAHDSVIVEQFHEPIWAFGMLFALVFLLLFYFLFRFRKKALSAYYDDAIVVQKGNESERYLLNVSHKFFVKF